MLDSHTGKLIEFMFRGWSTSESDFGDIAHDIIRRLPMHSLDFLQSHDLSQRTESPPNKLTLNIYLLDETAMQMRSTYSTRRGFTRLTYFVWR